MTKAEIAKNYFTSGYNCAQSVALAFKDELGFDEETVKSLTVGFGGGIARLRLTCGAVSAMVMILSYLKTKEMDKLQAYSFLQKACAEFKDEMGSLVCADLLSGVPVKPGLVPEERTPEYYAKRPCGDFVALCAKISEKYLNT